MIRLPLFLEFIDVQKSIVFKKTRFYLAVLAKSAVKGITDASKFNKRVFCVKASAVLKTAQLAFLQWFS